MLINLTLSEANYLLWCLDRKPLSEAVFAAIYWAWCDEVGSASHHGYLNKNGEAA